MDIDDHLNNVINRDSKDREVGESIKYFIDILNKLNVHFIVIGSSALQTYLPFFQRIPNDLDITLSNDAIKKIENYSDSDKNVRFENHTVACKLYYKEKFYLHLIPERMNYIDKVYNKIFTTFQVFHSDKTETRQINFINYETTINVQVPIIEYAFCLNILPRLDTNNFVDNIAIIQNYSLEPVLIKEFINRVPEIEKLIHIRMIDLRSKIELIKPDLVNKFDGIISTLL